MIIKTRPSYPTDKLTIDMKNRQVYLIDERSRALIFILSRLGDRNKDKQIGFFDLVFNADKNKLLRRQKLRVLLEDSQR